MKGVSEFIRLHEKEIAERREQEGFADLHLRRIAFLQHERLVHLLVMLAVIFFMLFFFVLFVAWKELPYLGVFVILLFLSIFYVFHYFKLENAVIRWYFLHGERAKQAADGSQPQNPN